MKRLQIFFPLYLQSCGDGGFFILERTIEVLHDPDLICITSQKTVREKPLRQYYTAQNILNIFNVTADFEHSLWKHDSGVMSHVTASFNVI